jgi:serine-type D-Ala-D-Ala carboxypeptidase/endopeptidase (penicillin-binding protein 4)
VPTVLPVRSLALLAIALGAVAGTAVAQPGAQPQRDLPAAVTKIIGQDRFQGSRWGIEVVNPRTGRAIYRLGSDRDYYVPGSTSKLFALSATWRRLGPNSRITTPLFALGQRAGDTLTGNLVLVGKGDLTFGGRLKKDGTIDSTPFDHTVANAIPGATITPQDPLRAIDSLARQVRAAGIARVVGDVVVDQRLFTLDIPLEVTPTPLMINENLIDVLVRPGARGAAPAATFRPRVSPYRVDASGATTGGPKSDITIQASLGEDGTITVTGNVPAGGAPVLRTVSPPDPADFARTALIEALGRAGVTVTAPAVAPNSEALLPQQPFTVAQRVAKYVSPPYSETAKLITYVSHNLGANLNLCLLAVAAGSDQCSAGFPLVRSFLRRAGVPLDEVVYNAPDGGSDVNRATPRAMVQLLRYWLRQSDGARFRRGLAQPGVIGSEALDIRDSPARGHIFAKSGLRVQGDSLSQRPFVLGSGYVGYLERGDSGTFDVFAIYVNNVVTDDIDEAIAVLEEDVVPISAALWEALNGR